MAQRETGDVFAESMMEIMHSESHQELFGKTAKKKCCDCEGKCGRKCSCKTEDGCSKSCGPCKEMAKKASESKCCDCAQKCADDCPCEDCHDCSACADVKMAHAEEQGMIQNLVNLSALQDECGLLKSAAATMRAAAVLLTELRSIAGSNEEDDQNQASMHGQILDDEKLTPDDYDQGGEFWDDPATVDLVENDPEIFQLLQEMAKRKQDREGHTKSVMQSLPPMGEILINEPAEGMELPESMLPYSETEFMLPRSKYDPEDDGDHVDFQTTDFSLPAPAKMKAWEDAAEWIDRKKKQENDYPETRDNLFDAQQSLRELDLHLPEDILGRDDQTMPPTLQSRKASLEEMSAKFAEALAEEEDEDFEDEDDGKIDVKSLFDKKDTK